MQIKRKGGGERDAKKRGRDRTKSNNNSNIMQNGVLEDINVFMERYHYKSLVFNSKGGLFESYLYEKTSKRHSGKEVLIHSIKLKGDTDEKVRNKIE